MKKFLILSLILWIAAVFCVAAQAEDLEYGPYTQGYFTYYITKNESGDITFLRITDYYGRESTVTVPEYIAGAPVDLVESYTFSGSSVTTVYLPAYTDFTPPDGILAVRQKTFSTEDVSKNEDESDSKFQTSYDLNGDEAVNVRDLVLLLKYVLGYDVAIVNPANPDTNQSGSVNLADCLTLLKYLCSVGVSG